MIHQLRVGLVPAYLALCLILGGASAAGHWANVVLQLLAIPIIAWSLLAERGLPLPPAARQLLIVTTLMLVIIAAQLIPLPPAVWTLFPGRQEIVSGFELLGMPLPWLSISTTPDLTVASALWLLPALAVLLAMIKLGAYKPSWIAWVLIGVITAGTALGAVQRAGGDAAYFYEITNYGQATGFFSNANHFGTLFVATMPFLAALYLFSKGKGRSPQHASGLLVILAGAAGIIVVGIAINGSLAAVGLSVPVIATTALMILSRKRKLSAWALAPLVVLTLGAVAVVFSAPLGNNLTTSDELNDSVSRKASFANTIIAAADFMPTGSGIGSFKTIYPMYEDQTKLTTTYVNHAHSDYLEIALEAGLPGILLVVLFLLWWVRRTFIIWRSDEVDQFARAATIASAAIIAHSIVDYPLRTAAISALFAICCALMAETRPWVRQRDRDRDNKARHLSAD